jgi:hypothetical protein
VAYQESRRSLLELETLLAVARHAGLLQPAATVQLAGRVAAVSRLLSGYVAYIDRQLADSGRALSPLATGTLASLDTRSHPGSDHPIAKADH